MKSINKLLISAVSAISLAMPLVALHVAQPNHQNKVQNLNRQTQPNHQNKVQDLNHQTQTNHQNKVQDSKPSDTTKPSEQGSRF